MSNLRDLFEYNTWANNQILAVTDKLSEEQRTAPMTELGGSVQELLAHTAMVEAAFLGLMTGIQRASKLDQNSYPDLRALFEHNSSNFLASMEGLEARAGEQFNVPWFARSFTIEQGLTQVATHSVQHRAGICAGIARAGHEAPGIDYIMWLNVHR
jgi:uncharacterized damage-inducible protein DinB